MSDAFLSELLDAATAPYRPSGRFAYHFARGKLAADPIFRSLLQRGLIPSDVRILDLGCGQALFASWLLAARRLYESGRWAADWPAPPRMLGVRGIELMARDVARARDALTGSPVPVEIVQGDICRSDFGQADVVSLLDVLHYVGYAEQEDILRRVRRALGPGGRLVARIGDADGGMPFRISNWVDQVVTFCRGHRLSRLYCRPFAEWRSLLESLGFAVQAEAMSQGTPFANVMLLAHVPATAKRL